VRLFHPLHLDGLCGAVYIVFLQVGCYCPPKNTVLTHRLLALRHVTPGGLLQGYRAVTLRERELNQRHTAGDRINTGVYVFTCVNASGMRQFVAKPAVRGYCGSNQGCCGVNLLKAKDRAGTGIPARLTPRSLRSAVRKGSSLRSDRCAACCARP
jgi:hypothetical protein